MKRVLLLAALAITISSLLPKSIYARSGCCSHHGGVCGCGCCDGTGLSNTCAPYYPQCSQPVYVAPDPTKAPVVYISTPKPTNSPTLESTSTPEPEVKGESTTTIPTPVSTTDTTSSGNPLVGLFTLGVFGGIGYLVWKKIRGKFGKQNPPTV